MTGISRRTMMVALAIGAMAHPRPAGARFDMQDGGSRSREESLEHRAPCLGGDPGAVLACEIGRVFIPTQPAPIEVLLPTCEER